MKLKVMLDRDAFAPIRAHSWDAGMDLRTPVQFVIPAGSSQFVDTGIHVAIPEGYVGMIKTKSGVNNRGVQTEGVIDAGYTGSIGVKLYNHSDYMQVFHRGDKITQLVILPCVTETEVEVVEKLDETERGDGGFGSTGR